MSVRGMGKLGKSRGMNFTKSKSFVRRYKWFFIVAIVLLAVLAMVMPIRMKRREGQRAQCSPGKIWDSRQNKCVCNGTVWDSNKKACVPSSASGPTGLVEIGEKRNARLTWYTYDDNTPPRSCCSSRGHCLTPFISVALPLRHIRKSARAMDNKLERDYMEQQPLFNFGDWIFVKFLAGRQMPTGKKHSGWVRVDDYCGDGTNSTRDQYCINDRDGTTNKFVDLYVGENKYTGYAGRGDEQTQFFRGNPPEDVKRNSLNKNYYAPYKTGGGCS